jgi:hypothetical protein
MMNPAMRTAIETNSIAAVFNRRQVAGPSGDARQLWGGTLGQHPRPMQGEVRWLQLPSLSAGRYYFHRRPERRLGELIAEQRATIGLNKGGGGFSIGTGGCSSIARQCWD